MFALRIKRSKVVSMSVLIGLIALLVVAGLPQTAQSAGGPSDAVHSIWQRANLATSYRFTASIQQTLIPRSVPDMIGEQNQQVDLHLNGEVQQPDRARIQITAESQSGAVTPVTLIREGEKTFIEKNGELLPADAPDLIIPNAAANFFDYLTAADNLKSDTATFNGAQVQHFTFDLNASRLIDQLVSRLVAGGNTAPTLPEMYNHLTGTGELWVDANGLPVRQIVQLNLPEVSDQYDARVRFVLDLSDWGGVTNLPKPVPNGGGTWILKNEVAAQTDRVWVSPDEAFPAAMLLLAAIALAVAFGLWHHHQRKAATAFIVFVVCFALIAGTPLQLLADSLRQAAPHTTLAQALDMPTSTPSPEQQKIDELLKRYGPQAATASGSISKCGDGDTSDLDADGLKDYQEACLGTDYALPDSDDDGLLDGTEALGFDYAGKHWTSDPLTVDSNNDGTFDGFEWPDPANINGTADTDHDTVPDLWDSDDDNDLLVDSLDMSPLAVTDYKPTFQLQTDPGGFTGTQYIEIEVQPQNLAHLQYSLTALDWPADDEGQIRDMNTSTNDVRLLPVLEISTNVAPTLLADKYGYSVRTDNGSTKIYAPVQPVSDGGAYRAFYAKVAYAPGELTKPIQWTARLVWMLQVQNDTNQCNTTLIDTNGNVSYADCTVQTATEIMHVYQNETFRVTGLKVTKSLGYESALFGTPQYATEDRFLFPTVFSLSDIFLQFDRLQNQAANRTALQEIAYRFAQPGTPVSLRFNLPTTVTLAVSATLSTHMDEGLAALNQTLLPNFLNTYYGSPTPDKFCRDASGAAFACATVGMATEYTFGSIDLESIVPTNTVQLNTVPLIRQRGLKALLYERAPSGTWSAASIARTLEIINKRYSDQMDTLLAQLRSKHPEATAESAKVAANIPYIAWWNGLERPVQIDADKLIEAHIPTESQHLNDDFKIALFNTVSLVETIFDVKDVFGKMELNINLLRNGKLGSAVYKTNKFFIARNGLARKVLGVTNGVLFLASLATEIAKAVCEQDKKLKCDATVLHDTEYAFRSLKTISLAMEVVDAFGQLTKVPYNQLGLSATQRYAKNALKQVKSVSGIAAVVGTVLTVGLAWTQFGLIAANSHAGGAVFKLALADAIASTLWALITLALSFIPFGIGDLIVAILSVIDSVVQAATGGKYDLATGLRKFFYDIKVATTLDANKTRFTDSGTGLADEASGVIPGNVFRVNDLFQAGLIKTEDGSDDDLKDSWAEGYFAVSGGTGISANATHSPRACTPIIVNGVKTCINLLTAEFKLITYTINAKVEFTNLFDFNYVYHECTFIAWCHTDGSETVTLPAEGDDRDKSKVTTYLDILPATIDELWNWAALGNPDRDGDGLSDAAEAKAKTDPLKWDTDTDGLSDAFEINRLFTSPLKIDTDGDGLSDQAEVRANTDPLNADTDGDSLRDGEEVFHFDGAQWVGGWLITLPGSLSARIYADPRSAENDGDGLYDNAERVNQLSPYAFNIASHLEMEAQPLAMQPGATALGIYARANTPVTYTLYLIAGQAAISQPLSACFPAMLTSVAINSTGGHRQPATTTTACPGGSQFNWNFGGANTLQIGEYFTATLTARTNPAATASISGTTAISVTTNGTILSDSSRVILDADQPVAAITAPRNGQILQRAVGGTTYIVGGIASDPTSWVSGVEFNPGTGFTAAQGTDVWSYAWNLPADGNYTLQARATDYVSYTGAITSVNVIVDGTAPTATLALADNAYVRPSISNTIPLSGTASDNLAGLAFVQVSINYQPWKTVVQIPANSSVLNTNWAYTWTLPATADASGAYRVAVRAIDRANNISAAFARKVIVDGLPPTDDLTTNIYFNTPDVRANAPLTLTGRANDLGNAPQPSRPQALQGTLSSIMSATVWLQYSTAADDNQGVRLTWLGDINGDARADLAVGLPASDGGAGRVAVITGRGGDWPVPPEAEAIYDSRSSFIGAANAQLGRMVSAAGDVNADGFADILMGDPANNRAFIAFGRGLPLGSQLPLTGTSPAMQWTVLNVAGLGTLYQVASAGDVNGDSYDDVFIVMDKGGSAYWAYLILGHKAPWYATLDVGTEVAAIAHSGGAVFATGVGDVNGDHLDDFVVNSQNTVWLFAGWAGFTARQAQSLDGWAITAFGSATPQVTVAPLGDINADGLSDFAFTNGNTPGLVLGRSAGGWGVSQFLSYNPVASGFIAAPGDVNGDGLNDILLGEPVNNNAYLILGQKPFPAAPPIAATLTGVAGAASAPYAAGADLNCDLSSDLLLLPVSSPAVPPLGPNSPFKAGEFVSPDQLPVQAAPDQPITPHGLSSRPEAPTAALIVDDDPGGGTYTTIQAAVNAALNGDTILVKPGAYSPFTVTGTLKAGISIVGVDPDAVFVDGGGAQRAILLQNVYSVKISNLTVRNAQRLIEFQSAGVHGEWQPTMVNQFDHMVLHSFSANAIYMDRVSTISVQRSTIASSGGSGAYLYVDPTTPDATYPNPVWTQRANFPYTIGPIGELLSSRGRLYFYMVTATSVMTFHEYISATNTWAPRSLPSGISSVFMVDSSGYTPAMIVQQGATYYPAYYNPTSDVWVVENAFPMPVTPGVSAAMVGDTLAKSYILAGGGSSFYQYTPAQGWTPLASAPFTPGSGSALAWSTMTNNIYVLAGGGNGFYRYNVAANTWTQLANAPFTAGVGAGLTWNYGLYAVAGGGSTAMAYYDEVRNEWRDLGLSTPNNVNYGGGLAAVVPDLYEIGGGLSTTFYRYGPAGVYPQLKAAIGNSAIVGGDNAAATTYYNLGRTYLDFALLVTQTQWAGGGTWTPAVTSTLTYGQAQFVNPTYNVYRTDPATTLTAGYFAPRGDVYVSTDYCASCTNDGRAWGVDAFASIQAAIDSHARRVLILPGVYRETFYLVNGVQVIGSGAESTIIQPPAGSTSATIVRAEGIRAATLARVTLNGQGTVKGIQIDRGAQGLKLARLIIRNTTSAIALDGSTTDVEIVNTTLVKNTNGIDAANNAGVDVRNSILAFNTGTAISYQSGAPTQLHQYNDYFANGTDVRINNVAQAANGLGEITSDPLFVDANAHNYRLLSDSPAIDAGNPTDPTPPGAGRPDMGYSESGQAAFYASPNYCAQCLNDGLEWQVDAFDKIQPALDAAARYLRAIGCRDTAAADAHGFCTTHATVGVGEGLYYENVSVPSYVRLMGLNAPATNIDASGVGSAVTFNGVIDAQVSGLYLSGSGSQAADAGVQVLNASNLITISRAIVANNAGAGVAFSGRSSGAVVFSDLYFNGSDGLRANGANTWATIRNSIIDSNPTGLNATGGGSINSNYNLVHNTSNYAGVTAGANDLINLDPQFYFDLSLLPASPAIDAAEPWQTAPVGGGQRADLGYKEFTATPLTLMFGKVGSNACYAGNSGVAKVELGVVSVADPNSPVTATLPGTWTPVTLQTPGQTASYWSRTITPGSGLSRLYTRATDVVGNVETTDYDPITQKLNLYSGAFIGDSKAPTVTLNAPINNTSLLAASFELVGTADDRVGSRFSVDSVYFLINGTQYVNASWVNDGWDGSVARTFHAIVPLAAGTYSVQAGAQDQAGNVSLSVANTLTIFAPSGPVVSIFPPATSPWTNQTTLRLTGAALFNIATSTAVTLQVNSGPIVTATLDAPFSTSTLWSANVTLSAGSNTITARARNINGSSSADNLLLALDTVSPTLTTPPSGLVISQTATLNGTASDGGSGLAAVEVSVDGGYLWQLASLNGNNWSFVWAAPAGKQNTSYPAMARAYDNAGNITVQSFVLVVDNTPPSGFNPITFTIPIGTFLTSTQTLNMLWTRPTDNGGVVTTTASINQISTTLPTAVMAGTSLAGNLNLDGKWYAHLAAIDVAGNRTTADYGPWYVNTGQMCLTSQRAIQIDGNLDTANNEWRATELLDDDERPAFTGSPVVRGTQTLYAAWDANAFYVGWRGAWWSLDGTLLVYLDTAGGGSTQPVSATVPATTLPFAADYAVAISGPAKGTLYRFIGATWQTQAGLTFNQSDQGDTEIRIPIAVSGLSDVRLLAFAMSDSQAVWSVFPTTNRLSGPWTDSYRWQPICSVTAPNANQPRGLSVLTSLTSPQSSSTPYSPTATLRYVVALDNREAKAAANVQVTLTASSGLTYQSINNPAGSTCSPCTPGSTQWRLTLPTIPTATTTLITFTGQLAANLAALPVVTSTLSASGGSNVLSGAALSHLTDGVPPTVTVLTGVAAVLRPGVNVFDGEANDGNGIGVLKVDARQVGASQWQTATGTSRWQISLTVPAGPTFALEVRATDLYNQISSSRVYTFTGDTVAPNVNLTLPAYISDTLDGFAQINGTTSDPSPAGGLVSLVEVQNGSTTEPWITANGPYTPTAGSQGWNFTWPLPISDGVSLQFRARATDAAGNVITGTWQGTIIDTVAPAISVTLYTPDIMPNLYATPARSGPPVLSGMVLDGGGISQTWAIVNAPDGTTYTDTISRTGNTWSYVPYLHNGTGRFVVSIVAVDQAGNRQVSVLYTLTPLCTSLVVQNANDSGLGSLRGTIACANPNDTITFDPSLAGQTIVLSSGALNVNIPITVDGSSAANVRISGNNLTRVFSATAPLTLKALTLQNGKATGDGGSLNTTSALTLTNVSVFSSTATGSGGGVAAQGVTSVSGGVFRNNGAFAGGGVFAGTTLNVTGTQFISNTSNTGGGVYVLSTSLLTNATFISNTTPVWGGAGARLDGPATVTGGLFQTNRAQLEGGGLLTFGTLNLINTQFFTNTANGVGTIGGGGVAAYGATTINGGLFQNNTTLKNGGGLYANATLNLISTQVISNGAIEGGGLYVANVAALTNASLISNTASSGGGLTNNGALTMTNSLLSENRTTGGSGGLSNGGAAWIVNSRFISNTTSAGGNGGGAIAHNSLSPLVLISSTIQGNRSTSGSGVGGGLYNYSGTVQITGTTIISNQAATGGALYTYGTTTLANSTLSGNTAGATGGGIYQGTAAAKLSLNNSTIAYNTAGTLNASGLYLAQGVMTATNSIIANNAISNNLATSGGTFVSLGYNLSNNWNGQSIQASDKTGDPLLNPLADNGGATWTHALQIGSPAINSANPATALPTDQRGAPRQGVPDIGAYEYSDCPLPPFSVQNANDSGPGSLRTLIACATPNATITFNPSLAGQTITLSSGALIVNAPITVDGSSAANVRLNGNTVTRIFSAIAPLTLKALTLQNGAVTGTGGAINTTSALTLTNVNVFSSTATGNGGGVAAQGATSISGGVFQNNRCTGAGCGGGGLFVNTTLNLTGTQFISNSAITGGGLYGFGATALTNAQFISNTSPTYGGGGARLDGPATVIGGLFQTNRAQLEGGGLLTFNTLVLSGTQFIANTAKGVNAVGGGGLAAYGATMLNSGLFRDNTTLNNGGGLHANAALNLTGTLFINNAANNGGGLSQAGAGTRRVVNSLFARNTATSTLGAALYLTATGSVQILHTTIGSPTLANGAAIFIGAGTVGITDTIIANHTIGISNSLGAVYENYNLFFGNTTNKNGSISGGTNDVSGDPRFQNSATDDYHLQSGSAAIDAGVDVGVPIDFDGDLRPIGNGFDIGFDETLGQRFVYLPLVRR